MNLFSSQWFESMAPYLSWLDYFSITTLAIGLGFHIYWASGGRKALRHFIPHINNRPLFRVDQISSLTIASLLGFAIFLLFYDLRPHLNPFTPLVVQVSCGLFAAIFFLRSLGDFQTVGWFSKVKETKFARWDRYIFSPLSLIWSLTFALVCLRFMAETPSS